MAEPTKRRGKPMPPMPRAPKDSSKEENDRYFEEIRRYGKAVYQHDYYLKRKARKAAEAVAAQPIVEISEPYIIANRTDMLIALKDKIERVNAVVAQLEEELRVIGDTIPKSESTLST